MINWLKRLIDIIVLGRGQGWWNKAPTVPKEKRPSL